MDEVLLEGRAVDAEHPAGSRVDPDDVVLGVDDDDPRVEAEQDAFDRRRPLGHRVVDGRRDARAPERDRVSYRLDHLRPRMRGPLMPGQATVDPQPPVVLSIRSRQRGDRLGHAEDEPSVRAEGVGEGLQGHPLERHGEVDQDVPAQEQVDPRERHARAQVVLAEDHPGPDLPDDLEARGGPREVAPAQRCREAAQGAGRVDAAAGEIDRGPVDVRREDADLRTGSAAPGRLGRRDGHGIRLLAGRAAGRPDAQLACLVAGLRDERRQDGGPEVIPHAAVAEELGDLDQQAVDEAVVLDRVALDERRVVGHGGTGRRAHPAAQATLDGGRLVGRVVDPAAAPDPLEEGGVGIGVARVRRETGRAGPAVRGLDEAHQHAGHRPEVDPRVDDGGRHGGGHRGERGGLGVLDDHRPAGPLDLPRAGRPIRAGAGQDHRDGALAEGLGRARQEAVDRRRGRLGGHPPQPHGVTDDLDQPVGRDDVDDALGQGITRRRPPGRAGSRAVRGSRRGGSAASGPGAGR